MMSAHALATLGALLCVACGGQVLLRLVALLFSVVPPLAVPGLPLPPSPCRRPDSARQPLHGSLLALSCSRRGPPAVMPA